MAKKYNASFESLNQSREDIRSNVINYNFKYKNDDMDLVLLMILVGNK